MDTPVMTDTDAVIDRSLWARFRRRFFWYMPPWWKFWSLYVRLHGVKVGKRLEAYGRPDILRFPDSSIELGDDVMLNSSRRMYASLLCAPTKLATLQPGAQIRIGNRVGISGSAIAARSHTIEIGDDTIIASSCTIFDSDWHHSYAEARWRVPGSELDILDADVHIHRNVWIGFGSIILKGVTIGENSIIGAGSVVTKDIPANRIAAGCPAKPIGIVPENPRRGGK